VCPSRKLQLTSVPALPVSHISPYNPTHLSPISLLPTTPKHTHTPSPRACQLGEFELTTPAAYHLCFVGCATHFSLAAQSDGQTLPRCDAVVGLSSNATRYEPLDTKGPAIFKFGAPPTAGTPPYPEYTISDRSLYVKMEASTSISAEMKGPEMTIHAPEIVRVCLIFSVHVASDHFLFSVLSM
jgi:hypothetical protein